MVDRQQEDVAYWLGKQLGTDLLDLAEGKIDVRRLSKIKEVLALCFPYFNQIPDYRGGRAARKLVVDSLNMNMSVDGWLAHLVVKAMAAQSGVQQLEVADKPGLLSRNLWNKKWKEKAELEGKVVPE